MNQDCNRVVVVNGGVVQGVFCDPNTEVVLVDWDNIRDGGEPGFVETHQLNEMSEEDVEQYKVACKKEPFAHLTVRQRHGIRENAIQELKDRVYTHGASSWFIDEYVDMLSVKNRLDVISSEPGVIVETLGFDPDTGLPHSAEPDEDDNGLRGVYGDDEGDFDEAVFDEDADENTAYNEEHDLYHEEVGKLVDGTVEDFGSEKGPKSKYRARLALHVACAQSSYVKDTVLAVQVLKHSEFACTGLWTPRPLSAGSSFPFLELALAALRREAEVLLRGRDEYEALPESEVTGEEGRRPDRAAPDRPPQGDPVPALPG